MSRFVILAIRSFDYIGNKTMGVNLDIELIGLKKGLEEIYNAL